MKKNSDIVQEYLSLKQSAEYLGLSESRAKVIWPGWAKYGCVPSRLSSRTLRFKRSDLDKMMEALKVQ